MVGRELGFYQLLIFYDKYYSTSAMNDLEGEVGFGSNLVLTSDFT